MPLPARIDAVLCDVGGPIYTDDNFLWAVRRAVDEVRAGHGMGPAETRDVLRVYDEVRQAQRGSIRTTLARELLGDESLRRELAEPLSRYWIHPPGTAYADAIELFRALHGRVRVAVVANQERATVDALTRDGFGDLIDVWGISAIVGHEKPSPEFFAWALRECGTTADHAVHIGNRLDTDVRPAKALGLGTIFVTRGEAPPHPTTEQRAEADVTVPDLTGVAQLILERAT